MCTLQEAVAYVVSHKQGTIRDLRKQIGDFYDSFILLGMIEECIPAHDEVDDTCKDWYATKIAEDHALLFGIELQQE